MIYIKRIYPQDLNRTPTFSNESVTTFFKIELNHGESTTRKFNDLASTKVFEINFKKRQSRNEYRVFLNDLFDSISPSIEDFLIFRKVGNSSFTYEHVSSSDPRHSTIKELLSNTNHELIIGDNDILSENIDLFQEELPLNQKSIPLNQILYGPPGTGKTYSTIDLALKILDKASKETNIRKQLEENRNLQISAQ